MAFLHCKKNGGSGGAAGGADMSRPAAINGSRELYKNL